jgi:hypothetical protein
VTVKLKSIIGDTPDGGCVVIDGREWIKLRSTTKDGKVYALLMLKDTIGRYAYGKESQKKLEYKDSAIKSDVNKWWNNLVSPTLKAMAVEADVGVSPNRSQPSSGTGYYAHLPRQVDVQDLLPSVRGVFGKEYWLANPVKELVGLDWDSQMTVLQTSLYFVRENDEKQDTRPIVWVLLP